MPNPFAEAVLSGQLLVAIPIAILAGLVSFASPCVLPLVPGYLGFVGGMSRPGQPHNRRRLVLGILLFILGFSVVFISASALFGAAGVYLRMWEDVITRVLGVIVILLGLVFIGQFTFLQRTFKPSWRPATGLVGAPILGLVFGLGWTPCIGPTLAAIQALSLTSGSAVSGALLGVFYCVGLGVPFLLVALGLDWANSSVTFLKRHIRTINIIGGVLLMLIGAMMVTGLWTAWIYEMQAVISGFVPSV